MFRRIEIGHRASLVRFEFEGRALRTERGTTLAAALFENGVAAWRRSPVGGSDRAPLCMIGVCFECLVAIEGQPQRQACLVEVSEGMKVHRLPARASS